MFHIPVLLKETLRYLDPKPGENFVDATLGGAGHTMAIFKKNAPDGKVLGIDLDSEMIKNTRSKIQIQDSRFKNNLILVNDSFVNLKNIVEEYDFKPINGILFDLGMSSWHLEESGRGFSFQKNEPLDMRYDKQVKSQKLKVKSSSQNSKISNKELTAERIINYWSEKELERIFREYGEERFSRRIAERICEERKRGRIKTTFQLIEIIRRAFPKKYKFAKISRRRTFGSIRSRHFATRVFQALRITVNDELGNLEKVLPQALEILEPRGRIVVIAFHSLEDRIVKYFFKDQAKLDQLEIITKKPVRPTDDEIRKNPRSRSAKLRAAIKI